jgi:hypothetical protein
MKITTIRSFAGITFLALGLVTSAVAIPITGSISFNGTPNFNNAPLSAATGITTYDSGKIAFEQQTGDYSALPSLMNVTFSPFVFAPPTASINPLWNFSHLGLDYSLRTTSMASAFNAVSNIWNFGGTGILSITGFEDTLADWNFSTGQIGQSFFFGSAAAARATTNTVPETNGTLALLALGLGCLVIVGRSRLHKAGSPLRQLQSPQLLG